MLNRLRVLTLAAGLLLVLASTSAGAVVIFFDGFNRPDNNNVGNGWIELENAPEDVAISLNNLLLRDSRPELIDAGAGKVMLSTLGLKDITLEFDWLPTFGSTSSDLLHAAYSIGAGGSYIDLGSFDLGTAGGHANFLLPDSVWDEEDVRILLWTNVGETDDSNNAGARIDNVLISGVVPEPSTLALLGLGVLAFAARARKQR